MLRIRSAHSRRSEEIHRSAIAFIHGTCGAVSTTSTPIEANTASKTAEHFTSRSRIRCVKQPVGSATGCSSAHAPSSGTCANLPEARDQLETRPALCAALPGAGHLHLKLCLRPQHTTPKSRTPRWRSRSPSNARQAPARPTGTFKAKYDLQHTIVVGKETRDRPIQTRRRRTPRRPKRTRT